MDFESGEAPETIKTILTRGSACENIHVTTEAGTPLKLWKTTIIT